jgi:unsaturated chondroitin disaccharide hydrolase
VAIGGEYREKAGDNHRSWWTNGFWPGLLWLAYRETGDPDWKESALDCERALDEALHWFEGVHHDVGFVWTLASVSAWKLTGAPDSRRRALMAASLLAGRFNPAGRFIRAWNGPNHAGWAIVDCLMNLPLLYWASEETKDPRFAHIARAHADTALTYILRPDGSVNHIVCFDPDSGEFRESLAGQGHAVGSSWSRGQAWALYGFALSYRHTAKEGYLAAAKRVAHYFLSQVPPGAVPAVDFRAPPLAMNWDSSAGAIAAAGLLEIAGWVDAREAAFYRGAAVELLRSLDRACGNWESDGDGLLLHGSHAWHHADSAHPNDTPLIYGDYFFAEAVLRLRGQQELFW